MSQNAPLSRAWITLGSNINPERFLPHALQELHACGRVLSVSSVWESEPVGFLEQPRFCNAAACLETTLDPHVLKQRLRQLEARLGRVRDPRNKNAPRTIDLDLVLYDDLVVSTTTLTLPDPEIVTRPFLAVPLAELDADHLHPVLRQPLSQVATLAGGTSTLTSRPDIDLKQNNDPAAVPRLAAHLKCAAKQDDTGSCDAKPL